MFKINKKAGLEIGINTIVILVIAMVVIGGGIAFIRTFFKLGEDKLKEPFELADFGLKPSSEKPLVLQTESFDLKTGKEKLLKGGYYNKNPSQDVTINLELVNCITTSGSEDKPLITTLPNIPVKANSEQGFNIIFEGTKDGCTVGNCNMDTGTYICSIKATDSLTQEETTQVTIRITN